MNHCWVPVPALYCNHGADLKQLNREKYCALVNYKMKTAAKHSAGRSPIKKFPFATTLPYAVQYVQFLQQKQKTVIYTRKAPRHPGLPLTVPYSRQKYKHWKKQTNQFARYYLTAYHPEVDGYAAGDMATNPDHEEMDQTCVLYSFNWKALQDFIEHCQCSNSAIDKFSLMLMRHRMVGMSTSTKPKRMLTDYRNHKRDTWLEHQQRELKYQHYLLQRHLIQGGNQEHLDEVDTCSERLTRASMDQILKQMKHDGMQLREHHNAGARMKFKPPDSLTDAGGASSLDLEPSVLRKEITDSFLCNVSADDMHLVAIAIIEF